MTSIAELQSRYPDMIPNHAYVAVGPRWIDLLAGLCGDLSALGQPLPILIEAKQKYAEMHLSFDHTTDQQDRLIRACEAKAESICPFCGDLPSRYNDCDCCRYIYR